MVGGEHADAERRWKAYVVPEAARLRTVLDERTRSVEVLTADNERRAERSGRLAELRATLGGDAHQFAAGLGSYRDHLDVTGSQAPKHVAGAAYRALHAPVGHYQPAVGHDTGPDL